MSNDNIAVSVGETRQNLVRSVRPRQWAKNLLVFLPMIVGHHFDLDTLRAASLAFVCFCTAASSTYIIDDLFDLPARRPKPTERGSPLASRQVAVLPGVALSIALMAFSLGLSLLLPAEFTFFLLAYVACTLAYSLLLKQHTMLDIIILAGLYTLRIVGGVAASEPYISQWLLMFSMFLSLSLALSRLCSELVVQRDTGATSIIGRGYSVADFTMLFSAAAASGYGAVFVVGYYMKSQQVVVLYHHPYWLWAVCVLFVYWISRILILANRGALHENPVVFAMTDWVSWAIGALALGAIFLSL